MQYRKTGVVGIIVSRNNSPSCTVKYTKQSLHATLVSRFTPLWSMEGGQLSLADLERFHTGVPGEKHTKASMDWKPNAHKAPRAGNRTSSVQSEGSNRCANPLPWWFAYFPFHTSSQVVHCKKCNQLRNV